MVQLSIIVPVYKVEDCLERCLNSIAAQTFGDFECILVDDGSPDGCGAICDRFAAKDARFVVIHQENQGLSNARNNAMKIIQGKYVAFVDSDDWIMPDMYEKMIGLLEKNHAQIAMCDYQSTRGSAASMPGADVTVCTGREFTEKVLMDQIGSQLWKFVYMRSLWEGIESPYRRHAQDMMILHRVTHRAEKVVATPEKLYCYNDTRETNISNSRKNVVKNKIDRALAFFGRMDFCVAEGYAEAVKINVINQALGFSVNAFFNQSVMEERFAEDIKTVRGYYQKYWHEIVRYAARKDYVIRAWLIRKNLQLYLKLYQAIKRS